MNRGIVMEMKAKTLIVMAPDGKFSEIPRASRECEVGEEIVYADPSVPRFRRKPLAWSSGLVAAVVFCLIVFTGIQGAFASPEVVAYVSMDINPSVELGIDAKERVRELRGLNSDGIDLIKDLDYKGKKITDLTEELLDRVVSTVLKDKDAGDIIIASTKVKDDAKLDDALLSQQLEQQVTQHVQQETPQKKIEVTSFAVPKEARETALDQGLSAGKLTVYLKAVENGQEVSIEEFKSKSVHDIAAEYGGVGKLIGQGQIKKEEVKELVQEAQSGGLFKKQDDKQKDDKADKQLDDKQKDNGKDNGKDNNGKGNSGKSTPTPSSTPRSGATQPGHSFSPTPSATSRPVLGIPPILRPSDSVRPTPKKDDDKNNGNSRNGNNNNNSQSKPAEDKPKPADSKSGSGNDKGNNKDDKKDGNGKNGDK